MPHRYCPRKISLQNDYAYCIISPVSPSVVPIQTSSLDRHLNHPQIHDPFLDHIQNNRDGIEVAEEAYLSLETNSICGFRRWSFCNFQTSGIPISAAVSETAALYFGNDDGYGFKLMGGGNFSGKERSSSNSISSSATSLSRISDMISNIPERIRKLSQDSSKLNVQSLQQSENGREQLKKLVVY